MEERSEAIFMALTVLEGLGDLILAFWLIMTGIKGELEI